MRTGLGRRLSYSFGRRPLRARTEFSGRQRALKWGLWGNKYVQVLVVVHCLTEWQKHAPNSVNMQCICSKTASHIQAGATLYNNLQLFRWIVLFRSAVVFVFNKRHLSAGFGQQTRFCRSCHWVSAAMSAMRGSSNHAVWQCYAATSFLLLLVRHLLLVAMHLLLLAYCFY